MACRIKQSGDNLLVIAEVSGLSMYSETNEHYRRLAFELNDGNRGRMLSGWQCENPFAQSLLDQVRSRCAAIDFRDYVYFDADEALAGSILALHRRLDPLPAIAALAGAGASSLISTFAAWAAETGIKTVYYVPPLYHTLSTGLTRYGIKLVPVSAVQAYERSFELDLPNSRTLLLLSDPIWYAGKPVPADAIEEIHRWQERTGSHVFIDGSLQYLAWDNIAAEASAGLAPDLTIRLISPCKQLAINGYRFAYLLLPKELEDRLAWIYANLIGPASAESLVFAHAAIEAVSDGAIAAALMARASARFGNLTSRGKVEANPVPDRGYYAFVRLICGSPLNEPAMDGRFFDQPRYDGFTKINLLSPSFDKVFGPDTSTVTA
jgi:aspartate/methionine/tyrosine aminotransferase